VTQLFPYQLEGARFLAERKGALLADEPRVGKTWPAIVASDFVCAENVLWITKGSARADHRRAWQKVQVLNRPVASIYSGADRLPDYGVIVISYDLATGPFFEALRPRRLDSIVLDEAHRVKNLDARRTQRILGKKAQLLGGLAERAEYGWALTGTPFPNNYAEIYPVARALFPDALHTPKGIMNYHQFEQRFCVLRDNGFGLKIVGNKNAAELHDRLAPYMLRRKFTEVWPDASQPAFEQLYLDAQLNLDELTAVEKTELLVEFAPMLKRAQDAGDTGRVDDIMRHIESKIGPKLQRLTGEAKALPLAEWVSDQIEGGIGKVVVFAWHRSVITALEGALRRHNPVTIDGRTTGKQKDARQQRFMYDPRCAVAIGQVIAAGEAIDLSAADILVFCESSWAPGDMEQAWRRILNVGKKCPLSVYFGTLADSIDEQIQAALVRKTQDIVKVLGDDRTAPVGPKG